MDFLLEFDLAAALTGVPYEQKWEVLKPELEALFHSNREYAEIALYMKTRYHFDAQVSAYKYRFNTKWAWRRSIPARKKDQILQRAQQRALTGKRTAAEFGNTPVDAKKLKRHVMTTQRNAYNLSEFSSHISQQSFFQGTFFPFGMRPFASWNMPLGGVLQVTDMSLSSESPNYHAVNTPSDVDIYTPDSHRTTPAATSPGNSSKDAPSPFSTAVLARATRERSALFLRGQFDDLIKTMNSQQQRVLSNWLHQFWMFAFRTCKNWGVVSTSRHAKDLRYTVGSPLHMSSTEIHRSFTATPSSPSPSRAPSALEQVKPESEFCKWSIHVADKDISFMDSTILERVPEEPSRPILENLQEGLINNSFSSLGPAVLPMMPSAVSKAVHSSPEVMLEEVLCFAIISGNLDAFYHALEALGSGDSADHLVNISALHIATSYLNGGHICCNLFSSVCVELDSSIVKAYTNDHGHTVLDNLMLTILRSHSNTPINSVDDALKRDARFAGADVDICGRWDADSSCFQQLLATGETQVPFHWKHKFCHTSVQAVCHCLQVLKHTYDGYVHHSSGLFQKLCTHCGLKLQLGPLHSVVMVTFELAKSACAKEDLFGMAACFLCLLSCESDPLQAADISVSALLGQDSGHDHCTHLEVTPYGLIQSLPQDVIESWPERIQTGWQFIVQICEHAELAHIELPKVIGQTYIDDPAGVSSFTSEETAKRQVSERLGEYYPKQCNSSCGSNGLPMLPFGASTALGHVWASVQAEILTYRKIGQSDLWLSPTFNIPDILASLQRGEMPESGYVRKNLLRPYCPCGRFQWRHIPPSRGDVMAEFCSNMECWDRTSFICEPEL